MKDTDHKISHYFEAAKSESPFGLARDYGFDTRLRESIRNAESGTVDFFAEICWRFSMVCLPLAVPALIAIAMLNSSLTPGGIGSAFAIWSDLISIDRFSLF